MCGILGGINTSFDESSLRKLGHRGPDQSSFSTEQGVGTDVVTLGQSRLNIVDRNNIDLPIRIGEAAILFNGEVYNYLELRDELERLGWFFRTKTDTEVVLAAYLHWGEDCLARFNGMFALAIWNGRKFFCARDRMGQKPLFYRRGAGSFEFASEIKAFSNLQFVGHDLFTLLEFCVNEHTLYKDVFSLRPGEYLVYDAVERTCYARSYWDIKHQVGHRITNEREAVDRFIELLEDSVRLRMRSDVPVSVFLSGGLDSSIIAKLAGVDESFTCQFDEFKNSVNEELYVRDLAERLGIEPHFVRPSRSEFIRDLPRMSYHLEMPTGSFSVFPLYRLAAASRDEGYKVVLSGEGADELFVGYARNEFLLSQDVEAGNAKERHYSSMLDRYRGSPLDRFCRMASRSGLSGAAGMQMFLTDYWSGDRSMLENISYVETRLFLQPLLQMGDRMCMAHGVENRCPYLDYRLVEFAFSLDDSLRFQNGIGKRILQEAARRLFPADTKILSRPVKDGLPTPVNLWMQGRHSFDRKHWNSILTAECMKTLLGGCSPGLLAGATDVQPLRFAGPEGGVETRVKGEGRLACPSIR